MTEELVSFDPVRFGRQIRQWREAAHLSQSELARRAGVVQSVISRTEAGDRQQPPSLGTCMKLSRALGVDSVTILVAAGARQHDLLRATTSATDPEVEVITMLDGCIRLELAGGIIQGSRTDTDRLAALIEHCPELAVTADGYEASMLDRGEYPPALVRLLAAVVRVVEADAVLRRSRRAHQTGEAAGRGKVA